MLDRALRAPRDLASPTCSTEPLGSAKKAPLFLRDGALGRDYSSGTDKNLTSKYKMSSVIRAYAVRKEGLTRFLKPETPCYDDGTNNLIFPFSYSNGLLDISYSGNDFKSRMVDVLNVSPNSETDLMISIMSGPHLVTSLGDNFKDYIRAWRDGTIDANSPIEIYIAPQVMRVQETTVSASNSDSYTISTQAPVTDKYIDGSATNNYKSTYVFKTPLTVSIVEGGVVNYITFRTVLDQE